MAMTLRLTEEESEALRKVAEERGISMQEAARTAVREYTAGWAATRDEFLRDFAQQNQGLLDRLAQ